MASAAFQPPPPQSMSGYLDSVTGDRLKDIKSIYRLDFNGALQAVRKRPSTAERLALLAEFSRRMDMMGRELGFLDPPKSDADPSASIAKFVIEDCLGFKGKSVDQKIYDRGISLTKDWVKNGLNSTGKTGFRFMEVLWKIIKADSVGAVASILGKEGGKEIASWIAKNWTIISKTALKKSGLNSRARYQIMRVLASRIALLKAPIAFLGRMQPIIFALDIFLTPTETVSDFEEQRGMFLLYYSQIQTDQNTIFSKLTGDKPGFSRTQLAIPLETVLKSSISSAPH